MKIQDIDNAYRMFRSERSASLRTTRTFDPGDGELEEIEAEAFNAAVAELFARTDALSRKQSREETR